MRRETGEVECEMCYILLVGLKMLRYPSVVSTQGSLTHCSCV